MGRALLVLDTPEVRAKAVHWIGKAPEGTRVEFKASKRTLPQNDMLWALLTEVSQQLDHGGTKYDPSQWKAIFLHAFGREVSFLPSLDRKTFLPLELSSSDLSKDEMTDFIEFIMKEAGERGVIFKDHRQSEPDTNSDDAPSPAPSSEPAGEVSNPPSASPAPIIECAKEMLTLAGLKYDDEIERDAALSQCLEEWETRLPDEQAHTDDIAVAVKAIIHNDPAKRRTVDQAREWLASRLGVTIKELGA